MKFDTFSAVKPMLQKLSLTAHITTSVGWIGAVLAFLPGAVTAATSSDEATIRAACIAMPALLKGVIVPLALGALATGLVCAWTTTWGVVRHRWVLAKLVLTVLAVLVLVVQVPPIEALAEAAARADTTLVDVREAKRPLVHAVGGLVVLLVIQALGVFKPRGLTPWGKRAEGSRARGEVAAR